MRQLQGVAMLRRFRQDIALFADVADERHHHFFPDGIDGWIGYLGEQLFEVVEQRLGFIGKTGQRRIGSHGPEGFFAIGGHGGHQEGDVFVGIAERALPGIDRGRVGCMHPRRFVQIVESNLVIGQPLAIRVASGQLSFDFAVRNNSALFQIDQEHLAGLEASLDADVFRFHGKHAGF